MFSCAEETDMEQSKTEIEVAAIDKKSPSISTSLNETVEEAPTYCNTPSSNNTQYHHHADSSKKKKRSSKICINYMNKNVWINLPSKFIGKRVNIGRKVNIALRRQSHFSRDYIMTKGSVQMARDTRLSANYLSKRGKNSPQRKMVHSSNLKTILTAQNNLLM